MTPEEEKSAEEAKKKAEKKENKLELTKEELDEKIAKAVQKKEEELSSAQKKKDEESEAERQRKAGEFEKLYQSEVESRKQEQAQLAESQLGLRREQVNGRLRDHIASNQSDYITAAKYMQPLINVTVDMTDDAADKQIKVAVDQYVKDNPRQRVNAPPPGHVRNKAGGGEPAAPPSKKDNQPARLPYANQF